MSFESFLADQAACRDYGDWLVVVHPVDADDVTQTLYFSRRGTVTPPYDIVVGSYTIPANTPFRRRLAVAPTISHSLWSKGASGNQPSIGGESQPAYGSAQLVNQDGGLDAYRPVSGGYRWKNTPAQIFFCDGRSQQIASTIGCIFDGLVREAHIGLGSASVDFQGFEARYGEMTSERVFRGTSYQLAPAINAVVDYGDVTVAETIENMSLEFWLWIDTAPSGTATIWGWTDGSTFPWRIALLSTRKLRLRATIGGSAETVASTTTLQVRRPYHISMDIDGRDVTWYIWDDDAQTLTTEVFTNGFSAASRDADDGGKLKLQVVDATAALWFDEMRVWDVARTADEHRSNRFGEIADGSISASLVHYTRMNDGTGTTVTDSAAGGNDGTITTGGGGSAPWLWAMEGGSELAGTPKPEVWGFKYFVAPVLVDPFSNAYLVSPADTENSLDAIVATFEGGNPHTVLSEAASLYAFITATPATGEVLPYKARGLFKLGSTPTLPVSATVNGFGGSGSVAYLPDVIEQLITTRLSTAPTLDTASFTALGNGEGMNNASFGIFLQQPEPIRQTLDFLMVGAQGWWGHLRGEQSFHVEQFTGPGAVADYDWTENDIVSIEPLDQQTAIYGIEVKFNHNHTVLSEDQVAATIKGTADWLKWTQEWQYVRRIDPTLREQFPGDAGMIYSVETGRRGRENAEIFADFLLQLLGGAKQGWKVVLKPVGRIVQVGQTATLRVTLQRGRSRLSLDGSKKYVVLDTTEIRQRGETQVTLWGSGT